MSSAFHVRASAALRRRIDVSPDQPPDGPANGKLAFRDARWGIRREKQEKDPVGSLLTHPLEELPVSFHTLTEPRREAGRKLAGTRRSAGEIASPDLASLGLGCLAVALFLGVCGGLECVCVEKKYRGFWPLRE